MARGGMAIQRGSGMRLNMATHLESMNTVTVKSCIFETECVLPHSWLYITV